MIHRGVRFVVPLVVTAAIGLAGWNTYDHHRTMKTLPERIDARAQQIVAAKLADIEERVVHLPEDGGAFYTTVFVSPRWQANPQERELVAWFSSHPQLASLKAQTRWNLYTTDSMMYRNRFAGKYRAPAVVLQDSTGKVWYHAYGEHLPRTPDKMAAQIIEQCPRPTPTPTPTPTPSPGPGPLPNVPLIVPDVDDVVDGEFPWPLAVLTLLLGSGFGVWNNYRKER